MRLFGPSLAFLLVTAAAGADAGQGLLPERPRSTRMEASTIRAIPRRLEASLFATGIGAMNPSPADGEIATVLAQAVLPVAVAGSTAAEVGHLERAFTVTYAGAAPGIVAGGVQINVQLPDDLLTGYYALELRVGDAISGRAMVFTTAK